MLKFSPHSLVIQHLKRDASTAERLKRGPWKTSRSGNRRVKTRGVDRNVYRLYIYVPGGTYGKVVDIALCDRFDLLKPNQF